MTLKKDTYYHVLFVCSIPSKRMYIEAVQKTTTTVHDSTHPLHDIYFFLFF